MAIPVSKVRGTYSAFYSKGLPQSLRSFAMTVIVRWDISLALNMTVLFLFYVILNDSEESHNLSEEYILRTISGGLLQSLRSFAMTVIVRWDISLTLNMTKNKEGYFTNA